MYNWITEKRNDEIKVNNEVPLIDSDWLSDSFLVKISDMEDVYKMNRFYSLVDEKFTDTSLGGNISLNCYPQFTRFADIRSPGLLKGKDKVKVNNISSNIGMGRYYGEVIDDNSFNCFFEFGVPEFNNILMYLIGAVDYKKSVIANSGRSPIFYDAGKLFGLGALVVAFPVVTIGLLLVKGIANITLDLIGNAGRFDHYYLKPTMFMYWSTVNSIVTMMSTELGILSPMFNAEKSDPKKIGVPLTIDNEQLDVMREIMPGLITSGNAINVHAMVARTQILHNEFTKAKLKALNELDITDNMTRYGPIELETRDPKDLWEEIKPAISKTDLYSKDKPKNFSDVLSKLAGQTEEAIRDLFNSDDEGRYNRDIRKEDSSGFISAVENTFESIFNEGARYAVFRVEYPGNSSESFSNSTTNVNISDRINSMGSTWRTLKFDMGGGEVPILSDAIKATTDFLVGAVDGLTLGLSNVVAGFLAGANIEVPKRWQESSANLSTANYKMTLISPSAHPIAQLRNIYIPLAAILAGTLPLSTGPKSHTSPYLCSMFMRGQQNIQLGMITSLTITRGTSNLPFNKQRRPLAIEVSFTVTDFSELISAPVSDTLLSSGNVMFDETNGLNRYIQSLCARDLYSTKHIFNKVAINLSRKMQSAGLLFSGEYWGAAAGDMIGTSAFSLMNNNKAVNYSELY